MAKFNFNNVTKSLLPTGIKAGGAVASTIVANKIPVGSDKIKNGLVTVAGLFLAANRKGTKTNLLADLGEGMAIGGILNLSKDFGIAGASFTDTEYYPSAEGLNGAVFTDTEVDSEVQDY